MNNIVPNKNSLPAGNSLDTEYEKVTTEDDLARAVEIFLDTEKGMNELQHSMELHLTKEEIEDLIKHEKEKIKETKKEDIKDQKQRGLSRKERKALDTNSRYERMEQDLDDLKDRLISMFRPLELGGLKPRVKFTSLAPTPATIKENPNYPHDDTPYDANNPDLGGVQMTLVVTQPGSKKESEKMRNLLRRELKDWQAIERNTEEAADSALQIAGAKCMTDLYAKIILDADEKSGQDCTYGLTNPGVMSNMAPYTGVGTLQSEQIKFGKNSLLGGEMFDDRTYEQKERGTKVAVFGAAIFTLYALKKAFYDGDKGYKSLLSVFGFAALGIYVWKGDVKAPHTMLREVMEGGDTYDRACEAAGIEKKNGYTAVPGSELLSMDAGITNQLIGGLPTNVLREQNLIEEKDGKVVLTAHPQDPNSSMLATYWDGKGDKNKAGQANSYFSEQQRGFNHIDTGLMIIGAKDDVLTKRNSTTLIRKYGISYEYRAATLTSFMTEYNLQRKPGHSAGTLVEQYLCHTKGITIEDLVNKGVFQTKETIDGYIPQFAPREQADALAVLPDLELYFNEVTIDDMKTHLEILPKASKVSIDWDAMYKKYPELENRFPTEEDQIRVDGQLTILFSQLIAFADDKATKQIFDDYSGTDNMADFFSCQKTILSNYHALGTFANDNQLMVSMKENPKIITYLETIFTSDAERKKAIDQLQSDNHLQFNKSGYELLAGVSSLDPTVKGFEKTIIDAKIDGLKSSEIKQLALRGAAYNKRLQNELAEPGIFVKIGETLVWRSYGLDIVLDITNNSIVVPFYNGEGTLDKKPISLPHTGNNLGEYLQYAQFAAMSSVFRFKAKTVKPWRWDGDHIDFKYYNSLADRAVDGIKSLDEVSEMQDYFAKSFGKKFLSAEGVRTFYPSLNKGGQAQDFLDELNAMMVWHEDSSNIENKELQRNIPHVENILKLHNQHHDMQVSLMKEKNGSLKKGKVGGITVVYIETTTGESVALDVINNQVGDLSLATMPNLETATGAALKYLSLKSMMSRLLDGTKSIVSATGDKVVDVSKNVGGWIAGLDEDIKAAIGQENLEKLKETGNLTMDGLQRIAGAIVDVWGAGAKFSGVVVKTLLGLIEGTLNLATTVVAGISHVDTPTGSFAKRNLDNDGVIDYNRWGKSTVTNEGRSRLGNNNEYSVHAVEKILPIDDAAWYERYYDVKSFDDWDEATGEALITLRHEKKILADIVAGNILELERATLYMDKDTKTAWDAVIDEMKKVKMNSSIKDELKKRTSTLKELLKHEKIGYEIIHNPKKQGESTDGSPETYPVWVHIYKHDLLAGKGDIVAGEESLSKINEELQTSEKTLADTKQRIDTSKAEVTKMKTLKKIQEDTLKKITSDPATIDKKLVDEIKQKIFTLNNEITLKEAEIKTDNLSIKDLEKNVETQIDLKKKEEKKLKALKAIPILQVSQRLRYKEAEKDRYNVLRNPEQKYLNDQIIYWKNQQSKMKTFEEFTTHKDVVKKLQETMRDFEGFKPRLAPGDPNDEYGELTKAAVKGMKAQLNKFITDPRNKLNEDNDQIDWNTMKEFIAHAEEMRLDVKNPTP